MAVVRKLPGSASHTTVTVLAFTVFDELQTYVHEQLCDLDKLDIEQTPLKQMPLMRGKKLCGIVFHAEGPRLLRTSAVWALDEARIIFYDSTGCRAREVRLSESPDAPPAFQNRKLG